MPLCPPRPPFLLALPALLLFACGEKAPERPAFQNVLLVSLDTTRADHLGCYGGAPDVSPNIDRLAAQGILFENVVSPVPLTLPSHSSLLTGRIPPEHGVHNNLDFKLAPAIQTLPEVLKDNGYRTGAVVGSYVLDSAFGLDQGFDTYNDQFAAAAGNPEVNERQAAEVSDVALRWLDENGAQKFFLFVHYYDPHDPYQAPEPFGSRFQERPYAGEIAYADQQVGRLLDKLAELKLDASTLVIVTADHGEMLGEHGEKDHSYFVYQPAIHVPLVMRLPGAEPRRVQGLFGLVDLTPTVLDLLGIAGLPSSSGQSLAPWLRGAGGSTAERGLYCESLVALRYGAAPVLGLVTERYKYIQLPRPELYDLEADPKEANNLAAAEPDLARSLRDRLEKTIAQAARPDAKESALGADDEMAGRLGSLGYVGGAGGVAGVDLSFDDTKLDPKDLVGFHVQDELAIRLVVEKKYEEARPILDKLLAERPDYYHGHALLGMIATALQEPEAAVKHLARAIEIEPNMVSAQFNLANQLTVLGRAQEAIPHYQKTLELNPTLRDARLGLAAALFFTGKFDEAAPVYERVLKGDPKHLVALVNLAAIRARQQRFEDAAELYRGVLKQQPDSAAAHTGLGNALVSLNREQDARQHLEKALELDPNQYLAHRHLARMHFRAQDLEKSVPHMVDSLRLEPIQQDLLGFLLPASLELGRPEVARTALEQALEKKPDWPFALSNLAWLLAITEEEGIADPAQAERLARRAIEVAGERPRLLDVLAIALAATGDFEGAARESRRALEMATAAGNQRLAAEIQSRLALFEEKKPYRPSPQDARGQGAGDGSG